MSTLEQIWHAEQALLLEKDRDCTICKGAGYITGVDLSTMKLPQSFIDGLIKKESTVECPRCYFIKSSKNIIWEHILNGQIS